MPFLIDEDHLSFLLIKIIRNIDLPAATLEESMPAGQGPYYSFTVYCNYSDFTKQRVAKRLRPSLSFV